MTRDEVRSLFMKLILPMVRSREVDLTIVSDETKLIEDLKVDSVRLVDIVLETEEQFKIVIPDEAMDGMKDCR